MPSSIKSKTPVKKLKLDISDEMIAERRGGSGKMPKNMPKWMASSIINIDLMSKWIGIVVCWITIPLIFAMAYEVLARKLMNSSQVTITRMGVNGNYRNRIIHYS